MHKILLSSALAVALGALSGCGGDGDSSSNQPAQPAKSSVAADAASSPNQPAQPAKSTVAVIGDVPYGADLVAFKKMPEFIQAINADKSLSLAMHAGDLHSGSEPCTEVYDNAIRGFFDKFTIPLVYTPGDNEWMDCQKKKQMDGQYTVASSELGYPANTAIPSYKDGNPVDNLALVRKLFFPVAGKTLGSGTLTVHTQAKEGSTASDRQFIENTWWTQSGVLFVAVNIPGGSNNGEDNWWAKPRTAQQTQEIAERTAATINWLNTAFDQAANQKAQAMVILTQADLWDGEKGPTVLTNYKQYVDLIASRTTSFAKPVLLINGDSHVYRSDNPLQSGSACAIEAASGTATQACSSDPYVNNQPYSTYQVPNFHRIVVHGSTLPMEWLKLTIDPSANAANGPLAFGPFSWERKQVQ